MNRTLACLVLGLLTLPIASVRAGEREYWQGKDENGDRFSFTNTNGDHWISREYSKEGLKYETVESNNEYIELKASLLPNSEGARVRLYKDKVMALEKGSRFKWFVLAKGTWKRL